VAWRGLLLWWCELCRRHAEATPFVLASPFALASLRRVASHGSAAQGCGCGVSPRLRSSCPHTNTRTARPPGWTRTTWAWMRARWVSPTAPCPAPWVLRLRLRVQVHMERRATLPLLPLVARLLAGCRSPGSAPRHLGCGGHHALWQWQWQWQWQ